MFSDKVLGSPDEVGSDSNDDVQTRLTELEQSRRRERKRERRELKEKTQKELEIKEFEVKFKYYSK